MGGGEKERTPTRADGASFPKVGVSKISTSVFWNKFRTLLILIFASKLRFCKKKKGTSPPAPLDPPLKFKLE